MSFSVESIGKLEFDEKFDYLIVYVRNGKLNTWTLPDGSAQMNFESIKNDKTVTFAQIYKRL